MQLPTKNYSVNNARIKDINKLKGSRLVFVNILESVLCVMY